MIRRVAIAVLCLGFGSPAIAGDETQEQFWRSRITIPDDGPLTYDGFSTASYTTRFKGTLAVDGLLVYGRYTDDPQAEALVDRTEMYLLLSESTRSTLPYFTRPGAPWRVLVRNPDDVLRAVGESPVVDRLKARSIKAIEIRGRVVLDSYELGVECDSPYYVIRFVAADGALSVAALEGYLVP